ncbi:hypothetical protein E2C01_085970 [Portunus trituberculatus]|uniref:Uncharacterized protein n=1 Tax=Portunus trituberculatus TaxID=210409 RepID=A0A5B7J481_PORTR|nr:hypothetical protein [Portunus trituberculatus]
MRSGRTKLSAWLSWAGALGRRSRPPRPLLASPPTPRRSWRSRYRGHLRYLPIPCLGIRLQWCRRLPLPLGSPSEPLPPNIHELLSGILAHLSSAVPLPCAQSTAPPLVADPHPATPLPLSSPASQPYGVDSSPVSDAPPSEEELELEVLPESWAPVPPDWQVSQVAGSVILLCRDEASQGEAVPVLGQEVCWGTSCHSPLPSWHFCPLSSDPAFSYLAVTDRGRALALPFGPLFVCGPLSSFPFLRG